MAETIAIEREETAVSGRYVAVVDGLESEMTFTRAKRRGQNLMIIDHTGVPKALSGRGVGLALVRRAVEDARKEKFRIVPLCGFVKVMIARRKDWQDVLAVE
jgi:predicted GNAT family acetyltransferase